MAITVTEAAAQHIKAFLSKRGKGEGLRLGIRSSGCSGFAYTVDYADVIDPQDTVFEAHGIKVVVDPKWLPFLDGMEVDYGREGLNAGFRFNNPNVKASCGCGESFSV